MITGAGGAEAVESFHPSHYALHHVVCLAPLGLDKRPVSWWNYALVFLPKVSSLFLFDVLAAPVLSVEERHYDLQLFYLLNLSSSDLV
jgi:hypothetical protein